MNKEIKTPENNSEEVDLGQLFNYIGNMFDRLFRFIGKIINAIFQAFTWIVFFIKKHFIKLVIASVIGFGFGFLNEKYSTPKYKSSIIIKQNYETGENLYKSIDYYNGLLAQKDFTTLAEELSIDSSYVSSIISFDVEAFISIKQQLVEYNNYTKKLDSSLATTLDYNDYLNNVNEYIYNLQQITIISKSNDNFEKLFDGIINNLNSNQYFKRQQEKDLNQLENQKLAVLNSLKQSDSLQKLYKKVLENIMEATNSPQTSITIEGGADKKNITREYDLFKNEIDLRQELVGIEREKENKESIVEVLSIKPKRGIIYNTVEILDNSIDIKLFYAFIFPFFLFSTLLLIRFIIFLEKYKGKI